MTITVLPNTWFTMAIGRLRTKGMERGEIGRLAKRERRALPTIRGTTTPHASLTTRHQKNIRNAWGDGIADNGVGSNGRHVAPVLYNKVSLSGSSAP